MAWLDPQWFTFKSLSAEWARKDVRGWLFGIATTAVVLMLFCHPEGWPAAVYIDSIGLELALTLLEMQLLITLMIYREQLMALLRVAYASNNLLGTLLRGIVAIPRYVHEALKGSLR